MSFRPYNAKKDRKAVHRIWLEVGWLDDEKKEKKALDRWLDGSNVWVAELNDAAECLVATLAGDLRYQQETLSLSCVTAVTNSRVARKQGLGSRLTAHAVAQDAAAGAALSTLGMFEQGFYNRLGFGTGVYENLVAFDPAELTLDRPFRVPHRLTAKDWEIIHQSRLNRMRPHGSCSLHHVVATRAEVEWGKSSNFGLGFFDEESGKLTHHFWASTSDNVENGPYNIWWMSYQNWDQFLDLLAVLKSLGDQVHLIRMEEPVGIQMQDLIKQPSKSRFLLEKSKYATGIRARAYWQTRINDLATCLVHTKLENVDLRFNLELQDPIEAFLQPDDPWKGVGGEYVVSLGAESAAEAGQAAELPTLRASVGAFTRMWLGVRPASGLAVTDELDGPQELLLSLDDAFRLPTPRTDWDF